MSPEYTDALATLIDPNMDEETVTALVNILTGETGVGASMPPAGDSIEIPTFTRKQAYDALKQIENEPAARQLMDSEIVARDPMKVLVDGHSLDSEETYEQRLAKFKRMTRQVEDEMGGDTVDVSDLLEA
tara:strand:+ start:6057 stop:6446 length:390 start_codon:yes stop_codon:yes gene_type:complete